MIIPSEFDEIRPYSPEELPQVFEELIADPDFQSVTQLVVPDVPFEILAEKLRQCKTSLDVQKSFFYGLLHNVMKEKSDGFVMDTSSLEDKTQSHVFMSNHRDIVLDSGLLCVGLLDNGFPNTVEIAIGDNLLIHPWIKKLVRINKSIIVQRSLQMSQMRESSVRLSRYIHFAIKEKKESVWIAQREGRAKDSNDRTQESVLKMLVLGAEDHVVDRLKGLSIVPLTVSYEYDPCDFLKAKEMQLKRDIADFKKSKEDDLLNMQTGIFGYKGKVHFQTGPCINDELETLRELPKTTIFSNVSKIIDKHIHQNYHLYPGNYIACDKLSGKKEFADKYTIADITRFNAYIQQKLDLIDLPNKDEKFLRECLFTMYANPTINYMKAISK